MLEEGRWCGSWGELECYEICFLFIVEGECLNSQPDPKPSGGTGILAAESTCIGTLVIAASDPTLCLSTIDHVISRPRFPGVRILRLLERRLVRSECGTCQPTWHGYRATFQSISQH
jgi:hypothetical protein